MSEAAGQDDVNRTDVEPDSLPDRTGLGLGPNDPQATGGKTGEGAIVVTALDAGLDEFGVTDFDAAARKRPAGRVSAGGPVRESLAHGFLKRTESERGDRACRGRRGSQAGDEPKRKRDVDMERMDRRLWVMIMILRVSRGRPGSES